jgi:hypothetical protein
MLAIRKLLEAPLALIITSDIGIAQNQDARGEADHDDDAEKRKRHRQHARRRRLGSGRHRCRSLQWLGIVERCPFNQKWCASTEARGTIRKRLPPGACRGAGVTGLSARIAPAAMCRRSARWLRIRWAFAHPRIVPPA